MRELRRRDPAERYVLRRHLARRPLRVLQPRRIRLLRPTRATSSARRTTPCSVRSSASTAKPRRSSTIRRIRGTDSRPNSSKPAGTPALHRAISFPMASAVWSMPQEDLGGFPAHDPHPFLPESRHARHQYPSAMEDHSRRQPGPISRRSPRPFRDRIVTQRRDHRRHAHRPTGVELAIPRSPSR